MPTQPSKDRKVLITTVSAFGKRVQQCGLPAAEAYKNLSRAMRRSGAKPQAR